MSIQFAARHRLYFASLASLLIASQGMKAGAKGKVTGAGRR